MESSFPSFSFSVIANVIAGLLEGMEERLLDMENKY